MQFTAEDRGACFKQFWLPEVTIPTDPSDVSVDVEECEYVYTCTKGNNHSKPEWACFNIPL